eukprot:gene2897-4957_t
MHVDVDHALPGSRFSMQSSAAMGHARARSGHGRFTSCHHWVLSALAHVSVRATRQQVRRGLMSTVEFAIDLVTMAVGGKRHGRAIPPVWHQLWLMLIRCYKMALNSKSVLLIDLSAVIILAMVLGFTQCHSSLLTSSPWPLVEKAMGERFHPFGTSFGSCSFAAIRWPSTHLPVKSVLLIDLVTMTVGGKRHGRAIPPVWHQLWLMLIRCYKMASTRSRFSSSTSALSSSSQWS